VQELGASSDIDAFLGVTRDLMGVALRSIGPEGLTVPQVRLMFVLHENGSTSSAQAARMLDLVPSSVTRMADRLVAAGLVERNGIPEHRGVVALTLTGEGDAAVTRVIARRRDELTGILDCLPPETRRAAADAMTAIHNLLQGDEHIGGVVL
jgi:DNA-binding MarR family transcriptional regulator